MGSNSVTRHSAALTSPPLPQPKLVPHDNPSRIPDPHHMTPWYIFRFHPFAVFLPQIDRQTDGRTLVGLQYDNFELFVKKIYRPNVYCYSSE